MRRKKKKGWKGFDGNNVCIKYIYSIYLHTHTICLVEHLCGLSLASQHLWERGETRWREGWGEMGKVVWVSVIFCPAAWCNRVFCIHPCIYGYFLSTVSLNFPPRQKKITSQNTPCVYHYHNCLSLTGCATPTPPTAEPVSDEPVCPWCETHKSRSKPKSLIDNNLDNELIIS